VLNLIGAVISVLVNIGITIAITRVLTRNDAGRFFAATSLFLLFESIVISGATTGIVYYVARSRARRRYGDMHRSFRFAAIPIISASVAVALITPLWAHWASHVLGHGKSTVPASALIVLFAGLPLAAVSDTALAATAGYRTMRPTVAVERVFRPALQGVLVLAVLPADNATLLVGAWVAPYLLSSIWALLWLRKLVARDPKDDVFLPEDMVSSEDVGPLTVGAFWLYTAPRGVATVASTALQRLDIVLVSVLSGTGDAALYTAATRFLVVGQFLGGAVATSVQPRLAGWFAVGDRAAVSSTYRTATSWVILGTWPFYLLCAWTAPFWLEVFGKGYNTATPVVLIIGASMLVATGCGMVSVVLVMGGRTRDNLINTLVALGLNVGIDLILIPHIGIVGAAIGWAVAIIANNLMPLSQVWRHMSMHPIAPPMLRSAAVSAACFGVVPAIPVAVAGFSLVPVVIGCAVGMVLYVAIVMRWYESFDLHAFRPVRREQPPVVARRP
jgi:O-antigen/teichoic acid export membrane protein